MVRAARPADLAAAAAVAARSYRAGFADILDAAVLAERNAAFFAERFAAALALLAVAERGGEVCGFSLVTHRHIDMLFVDPAVQRAGVGRRLLADAEERGANSLECFRANFAARNFYEGQGWELAHAYSRSFAGAEHAFLRYEKRRPPAALPHVQIDDRRRS